MEATTTLISATELKRLLHSIQEQRQARIRYRTIGRLWHPNFLRIIKIEENKSVLFHDETRKRLIELPDFSTIVQFELDSKLFLYEPNCHYEISEEIVFKDKS
jgi:hypothetical protein